MPDSTLPYASPPEPPQRRTDLLVRGIIAGTLASGVAWGVALANQHGNGTVAALVILLLLTKYVSAIVFTISRRSRSFGVGLWISLPIGFCIFFGVCFATLNKI